MKDLIKEVALEVSERLVGSYLLDSNQEYSEEFATAFLAALSKRAEAVAWMQISVEEGITTRFPRADKPSKFNPDWWRFDPLFTFPPIHDIEAIENRVAEACAKTLSPLKNHYIESPGHSDREKALLIAAIDDATELLRSGEWRKYK